MDKIPPATEHSLPDAAIEAASAFGIYTESVNRPYRELVAMADVAHGTVG
jgi:hypothetical protein